MSESAKIIIKYFCDRFLELDYYPTSLKAVLDLKISKLKEIDKKSAKILKEKGYKTIRDVGDMNRSDYRKIIKKTDIDDQILKNIYISANLVSNAWNKRNTYLKKVRMKVVVAGLDFAGKTSLMNRLIHNKTYHELIDLEPTKGANVEEFQSDKLNLIMWDLGGQKRHIDQYLEEPEKFFVQVDVFLFVIDSQDDVRYDMAVDYLEDLLNILDYLDEFPYILILLNKADSDLVDDPDFQIKLEYLTDKITKLFEKQKKSWSVEIIPTSIYNVYANEPEIARSIKSIFSKDPAKQEDERISDIDLKVQKILDVNLKLMDKMATELNEIKRLLIRVLPTNVSSSLFDVPFQKVPLDFISDSEKKKKRKKESKRIPQPLEFSREMKPKKSIGLKEELLSFQLGKTTEKSEESDKSIEHDDDKPPMAPPKVETPDKLNPPPSPPKMASPPTDSGAESASQGQKSSSLGNKANLRQDIISELKDLFVKKGIAP
ncbi:MAG: hypothetical protein GF317_03280 [Candidatus Lokiarchaeota archaeon]|nr:hypothetical protein [Candidatus Lokiarchaeota archaeon]MBD3198926.1 hypothetical protein [Candidatus Lokiarchaeota archaeon]